MTASKLARDRARGLLLSTLEEETILTRVNIVNDEGLAVETKDWDSYWQSISQLSDEELARNLKALHTSWFDYLHSSNDNEKRREYCYRYFSFLNSVLTHRFSCEEEVWHRALQTTLAFECFGITSFSSSSEVLLAGTSTMRNPCYLLTKLKYPDAMDDSRFLPFISIPGSKKLELFFHYRQYSLSTDSNISLLLYPIIDQNNRTKSMKLLNRIAGTIRYAADPWTNERGALLFKNVIQPIIQQEIIQGEDITSVKFLDIGAGSGSLVAYLCRNIQKMGEWGKILPRFDLVSVDLEPADPVRFLKERSLRKHLDSLEYVGSDYTTWLSESESRINTHCLRVALLSKVLDTCSDFFFSRLTSEKLQDIFQNGNISIGYENSLPQNCLSSENPHRNNLVISNATKYTGTTRIYPVLSLSSFYQGMGGLFLNDNEGENSTEVFLPSRRFNKESLVDRKGESIISRVILECNYFIIIDMDLTAIDVIEHMKEFALDNITVCDMTRSLRLKNNYAYVLSVKSDDYQISLKGEYIW